MMKRFGPGLVVFVLGVVSASVAWGQGRTDLLREVDSDLLRRPAIRPLIELGFDQHSELEEARVDFETRTADLNRERDAIVKTARPAPNDLAGRLALDDRSTARLLEINREKGILAAERQRRIRTILKPDQVKRLIGINLQRRGPEAFEDTGLLRRLNIDEAKHAEIEDILKRHRVEAARPVDQLVERYKGLYGTRPDGTPDYARGRELEAADPGIRAKADAYRSRSQDETLSRNAATVKRILRTLTRRQREAYVELIGEPVDVKRFIGPFKADDAPVSTTRDPGRGLPPVTPK